MTQTAEPITDPEIVQVEPQDIPDRSPPENLSLRLIRESCECPGQGVVLPALPLASAAMATPPAASVHPSVRRSTPREPVRTQRVLCDPPQDIFRAVQVTARVKPFLLIFGLRSVLEFGL
ncbi:hypothetical protein GE061_006576 [Apolygus lucorum]|uniref:Uncharacterized protein n=1 Tax=Apolygus lucorum TaxID=248454 RepID=A0A8S9WU98_APOLU|nr:hypothetical protein GE061_006576 [Apolygus lucorum]